MKKILLTLLLLLPYALYAQKGSDTAPADSAKPASAQTTVQSRPVETSKVADSEASRLNESAKQHRKALIKELDRQREAVASDVKDIADSKTPNNGPVATLVSKNAGALASTAQKIVLAESAIEKATAAEAAAIKATTELAAAQKKERKKLFGILGKSTPEVPKKKIKKINKPAEEKLQAAKDAAEKLTAAMAASGEDKKEDDKSKEFAPFRLWIGTNFDLLEKIKATKLYGNVDFTLPIVNKQQSFLLAVGAFQNRSVSVDSTRRAGEALDRDFRAPILRDSIQVIRTSYRNQPTTSVNNLGFYFTYGVRIFNSGNSVKITGFQHPIKNINGYLAVRSEVIRRQYSITNNYEILSRDTVRAPVPVNTSARYYPLAPDRVFTRTVVMIQAGFPILVVNDNLEMRFAPYVGLAFEGRQYSPVANLNFNITEKAIGLSIGGEARTIFKGEPILTNLYIAKSFTLNDFKDLLKFD